MLRVSERDREKHRHVPYLDKPILRSKAPQHPFGARARRIRRGGVCVRQWQQVVAHERGFLAVP